MVNKEFYTNYAKIFLEENSKVNLISKNDEKYLWEKHIYDSLAIKNFFDKYKIETGTMLDIGTGGGFPAIPIALTYPKFQITAVDSIAKKIRAVNTIKTKLCLKNLNPVCSRVENLHEKYDIIVSRAVSSLKNICLLALPKLKKEGYFVAYKSKKVTEEIEEAKKTLLKFNAVVIDIIEYEIPIDEKISRNLVIIKLQ